MTATWEIREGDALERLREIDAESVQCCVTSPPYFGLRDYGIDGQIGLESTPDEFVARLVEVFREVRRVLRDDGTVWLNIGDSYAAQGGSKAADTYEGKRVSAADWQPSRTPPSGVKPKDLLGVPWLLAFALRADGWYLRSDIIWAKPNPMPESVTDRPTSAHEHVFLLAKSPRYFYDADAIREADSGQDHARTVLDGQPSLEPSNGVASPHRGLRTVNGRDGLGRNKRNVWEIATQPYPDAHFATFPRLLVEPCVLAGSSPKACGECGAPRVRVVERDEVVQTRSQRLGVERAEGYNDQPRAGGQSGLVAAGYGAQFPRRTLGWQPSCAHEDDTGHSVILDPFAGSGTTGLVALRHDRSFIGIELSPVYAEMARNRIRDDAPLLNSFAEVAA